MNDEHPFLIAVHKRIRAITKKLTRIERLEEQVKEEPDLPLEKEQQEVLSRKSELEISLAAYQDAKDKFLATRDAQPISTTTPAVEEQDVPAPEPEPAPEPATSTVAPDEANGDQKGAETSENDQQKPSGKKRQPRRQRRDAAQDKPEVEGVASEALDKRPHRRRRRKNDRDSRHTASRPSEAVEEASEAAVAVETDTANQDGSDVTVVTASHEPEHNLLLPHAAVVVKAFALSYVGAGPEGLVGLNLADHGDDAVATATSVLATLLEGSESGAQLRDAVEAAWEASTAIAAADAVEDTAEAADEATSQNDAEVAAAVADQPGNFRQAPGDAPADSVEVGADSTDAAEMALETEQRQASDETSVVDPALPEPQQAEEQQDEVQVCFMMPSFVEPDENEPAQALMNGHLETTAAHIEGEHVATPSADDQAADMGTTVYEAQEDSSTAAPTSDTTNAPSPLSAPTAAGSQDDLSMHGRAGTMPSMIMNGAPQPMGSFGRFPAPVGGAMPPPFPHEMAFAPPVSSMAADGRPPAALHDRGSSSRQQQQQQEPNRQQQQQQRRRQQQQPNAMLSHPHMPASSADMASMAGQMPPYFPMGWHHPMVMPSAAMPPASKGRGPRKARPDVGGMPPPAFPTPQHMANDMAASGKVRMNQLPPFAPPAMPPLNMMPGRHDSPVMDMPPGMPFANPAQLRMAGVRQNQS